MILGICGGTASGKTTFTRRLLETVSSEDVLHIEHDSYYHDPDDWPDHIKGTHNFDHPHALDTPLLIEHLRQLRTGKEARQPVYDFATHRRKPETRVLPPRPVIIVEGILIFADEELRKLFDIKVFIDADDDVRILRRFVRDVRERGRTPESILEQYLSTVRPMHKQFVEACKHHADIIVPGLATSAVAIELLATQIRARLGTSLPPGNS